MEEVNKKLTFLDDDVKKRGCLDNDGNIKAEFLKERFIDLQNYHDDANDDEFDDDIETLWTSMDHKQVADKYTTTKNSIADIVKNLTNLSIVLSETPVSHEYLPYIRIVILTIHINTDYDQKALKTMYKSLFNIYRAVKTNTDSLNWVIFKIFNDSLLPHLSELNSSGVRWDSRWTDVKPLDFRSKIGPMEHTLQNAVSNYFQSLYTNEDLDTEKINIGPSLKADRMGDAGDGRLKALYRMTGTIKATYKYMLRNATNFKIIGAYKDAFNSSKHVQVTPDMFNSFIKHEKESKMNELGDTENIINTYNKLLFIDMNQYFKTFCDNTCKTNITEDFLQTNWGISNFGVLFSKSTEEMKKRIGKAIEQFYVFADEKTEKPRSLNILLPIDLILDVIHDILPKELDNDNKSTLENLLNMIFKHIHENLENYNTLFDRIKNKSIDRNEPMDIFTFIKLRKDEQSNQSVRYTIEESSTKNLLKIGYLNDSESYYKDAVRQSPDRNSNEIDESLREYHLIEANQIYGPQTTNKEIVETQQFNKIIEDLNIGKSTTIMMYGTSGSGKTSTMITLKVPNERPVPGIIPELLKKLTDFNEIELRMIEFQRDTDVDEVILTNKVRNPQHGWFRSDGKIPESELKYPGESKNNLKLETEWDMRKYFYDKQVFKKDEDEKYKSSNVQARTQVEFAKLDKNVDRKDIIKTCSNYFEKELGTDYELTDYLDLILNTQRVTKATPLNWRSSRSHMIISLGLIKDGIIHSRINICDLAGIEAKYECNNGNEQNEQLINKLRNIQNPEDDSKMAYDDIIEDRKQIELSEMEWIDDDKKITRNEISKLENEEKQFHELMRDTFKKVVMSKEERIEMSNKIINFTRWLLHLGNFKTKNSPDEYWETLSDALVKLDKKDKFTYNYDLRSFKKIGKINDLITTPLDIILRKDHIFNMYSFSKQQIKTISENMRYVYFAIAVGLYVPEKIGEIDEYWKDDVKYMQLMRSIMQNIKPNSYRFNKVASGNKLPPMYKKIVKYNIAASFDNDILHGECVKRSKEGQFINKSLGVMSMAINAVLKNKDRIPDAERLCLPIQCNSIWGDCFSDIDKTHSDSDVDPIGSIIESLERAELKTGTRDKYNGKSYSYIMNTLNFGIFNVINISAPYKFSDNGSPVPKDPFSVPFIDFSRFMLEINRIKSLKNMEIFPKITVQDGKESFSVIPEKFHMKNIHPYVVYDLVRKISKHYIDQMTRDQTILNLHDLSKMNDFEVTDIGWNAKQIFTLLQTLKEVFQNNHVKKYGSLIDIAFFDSMVEFSYGKKLSIFNVVDIKDKEKTIEWPIKTNNILDENGMDDYIEYLFDEKNYIVETTAEIKASKESLINAVKFIGMLDTYTASNPMSTLAFIDSMTKYGAVRTTCSIGSKDEDGHETTYGTHMYGKVYETNMKSMFLKDMKSMLESAIK